MIYTSAFRAMGCEMMAALDGSPGQAQAHLARVPLWFEAWEQALSRFRPESELSRLNQSGGQPFQVSPELWAVFQAALAAERYSGGLVTPLVYEAVVSAGYAASFETLPAQAAPSAPARPAPPLASLGRDEQRRTLRLPPGNRLDFGGTAKGWAASQAMQRLRPYGPALVDAGGDIAISGLQADRQPWLVGIADPFEAGRHLAVLALGRAGVATSGRDYRKWVQAGRSRHHIIDPRTGEPAETDLLTATIIAPDLLRAEAAAKTALILGSAAAMRWLEAQPGLAACLVLEDGRQLRTRNLAALLADEDTFVEEFAQLPARA